MVPQEKATRARVVDDMLSINAGFFGGLLGGLVLREIALRSGEAGVRNGFAEITAGAIVVELAIEHGGEIKTRVINYLNKVVPEIR